MHFNKFANVFAIVASSWQRDRNTLDWSHSKKSVDLSPVSGFQDTIFEKIDYIQDVWDNITDPIKSSYISWRNDFDDGDPQKALESFQIWWKNSTKGRSGLLVHLVPALASQVAVVKKIAPFFVSLTTQYIEPLSLVVVYSLYHNRLRHVVRTGAVGYVCLSAAAMLFDLYLGGSTFLPFSPKDDSYTLITE